MAVLTRIAAGFTFLFTSSTLKSSNERANTEVKAKASLSGNLVSGEAEFFQPRYTLNTEIKIKATGLNPNKSHGLQIHELTKDGQAAEIFNPFARKHGGPWSTERKVGDIGNIKGDEKGEGAYTISDPYIKLSGKFSVIGKIIAIHENPDDLGYGRNDESLVDGQAGKAISAGAISQIS
ncbi:unnamed protein product [Blepharisma stoltei]|uniref:Superoxide dismutase copper/zinc binding domain-containing protein n=1 Tax=Blepharisma stoltei TaxID=1481888 RepID=A0AAU9JJL2_9CILI|nr:unnamed protein product [Blepharisma stoltei]